MLELHYPTVTKTILERQYPGKPTLKVAFGNDNGAILENFPKLRASLFVTSRWPRSSGQTNYQVHPPGGPTTPVKMHTFPRLPIFSNLLQAQLLCGNKYQFFLISGDPF